MLYLSVQENRDKELHPHPESLCQYRGTGISMGQQQCDVFKRFVISKSNMNPMKEGSQITITMPDCCYGQYQYLLNYKSKL